MFWETCPALEIFKNNIADWGPVNSLKRAPAQAYSYEFDEIFKNSYCRTLASGYFFTIKGILMQILKSTDIFSLV